MLYGTDNGPICTHCLGSVYAYTVIDQTVNVCCVGCRHKDTFRTQNPLTDARSIRSAHERRAIDPTYWGAY